MSEVICVGIGCVDVLIRGVDLAAPFCGEAKKCEKVSLSVGGDAVNQAIVLNRLGVDVELMAGIGDDAAGDFIAQTLRRNGLPATRVGRMSGASRVNVIVVAKDGQRNFIHERAPAPASLFTPELDVLEGAKVVSLGSLLAPPFLTLESMLRVIRRAKKNGSVVCADIMCNGRVAGLRELAPALAGLDYFFPNYDEAAAITGRREVSGIADVLLACGVKNVIVKMGRQGCFAKNQNEEFSMPAFQARVVDTTGAGDNFASGFIRALLGGGSLRECCRFGTATASLSVQGIGATAGVESYEQVLRMLACTDQDGIA